ncbi:MAG: altronate dehydratase family protein [Pirellulaceae bacterium]|nr:altronate dehydratase family protein [Pirellulaceae bacterium]
MFARLHPQDNVVVSLQGSETGSPWEEELANGGPDRAVGTTVVAMEPIPAGHKMAIRPIAAGQWVIKYGLPIGLAQTDIAVGQRVHVHNVKTGLDAGIATQPDWEPLPAAPLTTPILTTGDDPNQFLGYLRENGQVAIRNEIWILNTVGCVNQTAQQLAAWANRTLVGRVPNLDGVYAFSHPYGCSQLGDDLQATRNILSGLTRHPHAAAVLFLGLGCENNQLQMQLDAIGPEALKKVRWFSTQDVSDEMEQGRQWLTEMAQQISRYTRQPLPANKLILGMKCGGSDGFSGLTANPLLGRIADWHCAMGGTSLLTEVPEMFGAEPVLLGRCDQPSTRTAVDQMIETFKDYFRQHDQPISENPSPGNKDGGLTTLEEKSLGCVQKGGTAALIKQCVPYGGQASAELGGLGMVNGPGNDGVSITALTAAGAHLVLFTTGRGTPMGAPAPTMKIATNPTLAKQKPGWIDFSAGDFITGTATLDELRDRLWEQILRVASGQQEAKNELNGYREIAIWKIGVTV